MLRHILKVSQVALVGATLVGATLATTARPAQALSPAARTRIASKKI